MKKRMFVPFVSLLLISTAIFSITAAKIEEKAIIMLSRNILYVGGLGPNNYTTIQEAIYDALAGDTVFVFDDSSPYYETVTINKRIQLIGENRETTIIDGQNHSEVVHVSAEKVVVRDFTIRNGTDGVVVVSPAGNVTIADNIITGNYMWAIMLSGSLIGTSQNRHVISGNTIRDNGLIPNTSCGGIALSVCAWAKITNNNFYNNSWNAFFFKSMFNRLLMNYWDRPRLLPYPILGLQAIIPPLFWMNFDWRPRLTPYTPP